MRKQKFFVSLLILAGISMMFYSFKNDESSWVKTELYFGLSRNDSGYVTWEEWQSFHDTVITRAFQSGSTTFEANGRWLNEFGIVISENSKVVVLINEMNPDVSAKIDSLREKYKRYHHQSAVLRVDQKVEVSF
jgi:hypothetical protein